LNTSEAFQASLSLIVQPRNIIALSFFHSVMAIAEVEPEHVLVCMIDRAVGNFIVGRDEEGFTRLLPQEAVSEKQETLPLELTPNLLAIRAMDMRLGDVELVDGDNSKTHRVKKLRAHIPAKPPADVCPVVSDRRL